MITGICGVRKSITGTVLTRVSGAIPGLTWVMWVAGKSDWSGDKKGDSGRNRDFKAEGR